MSERTVEDEARDEAERAVLGAMLLSGAAVERATGTLRADDFYRPRHVAIFHQLLVLYGDEKPTDVRSVIVALADAGELDRAGRAEYLHDLIAPVPSTLDIDHHIATVVQHAERRRFAAGLARVVDAHRISDAAVRAEQVAARLAELVELGAPKTTAATAEPDSWAPVALGPYLRGEVRQIEPTLGVARRDGLRLLYPAKEHSVIGEMESGKSWFLLACAAAEMTAGRHVVYVHFEESDPTDSVERLQALGVPDDTIDKLFVFVGPHRPVSDDRMARLVGTDPSLAIVDGVNEGMILHGHKVREEDGAGEFRRRLIKPFTAAGAAVLTADHVVKDEERRGRYALGSIHKGNAINGALILLENADPFGRGQRGTSRVYAVKDRPGHLRRHGQPTKTKGKTYLGQLVVDDSRTWVNYLDLAFLPPTEDRPAPAEEANRPTAVMAKVAAVLGEHPGGLSKTSIETLTPGRAMVVRTALELLVNDGYVLRKQTGRNTHLHTLIKPFEPGEETSS